MKDEKQPPPADDEPEAAPGQAAATDAQGKVATKDERSPAEQQAEVDLLKTSGGNPLTQEG